VAPVTNLHKLAANELVLRNSKEIYATGSSLFANITGNLQKHLVFAKTLTKHQIVCVCMQQVCTKLWE